MSIAEKLTTIAENEQKVYDAGQKSEYDRFWDSYQANGKRTAYAHGFGGVGWTDEVFYPKYDIKPKEAYMLFRDSKITDIYGRLEELGLTLDFSNCTNMQYALQQNYITRIGIVDVRNATGMTYAFFGCSKVVTFEKLIIKEDGTTPFENTTFQGMTSLENLTIEGVIGTNKFNVSTCTKLSHDSLMNIINCLKDYKGSGTTYTVTLGTTNLAKLTDEEKAIATQKGWTLA